MLLILPALGGLATGLIVYRFAPEAAGAGVDPVIDAYHNRGAVIRGRVPLVKTIASAVTLTTGGSGGREGPIAQIGAGFGSYLATRLGLSERHRRILLAAGVGACVGSIFRAPLAGALFAAEVLYRDPEFEAEVIMPAGIASVVAYCVFCLVFGWGSLFQTREFTFRNPLELGPYAVLALVVTGVGFLYVKAFHGLKGLFSRIPIAPYYKPALGGLFTGIIGFFLPQTLSFGYGYIQTALEGNLGIGFLLALGLGKILTTSFSIGSGGSGGVLGPALVIGGAVGGVVANIFHILAPSISPEHGAFVVVGMAAFFAGVSRTPISTIIFVSELTNSFHLLLPSLLTCSIAYILSSRWTLFSKQVKSRIDSNAHKGEFFVDVLADMRVEDLLPRLRKVSLVREDMSLADFLPVFQSSDQHYFPVVDREGRLKGIFSINDIRGILLEEGMRKLVCMRDIARSDVIYTKPSEDLGQVMKKFTLRNINSIPVVRDEDSTALLGMLDRRTVIAFYNQKIEEIKKGTQSPREIARTERPEEALVSEAMTRDVKRVLDYVGIQDLMDLFHAHPHNTYPVTDHENRLVGVISLTDYQKALLAGDKNLTAGEIATRDVVTVFDDTPITDALQKILSGDFAILPVLSGKDGKTLMGVISRRDILRFLHKTISRQHHQT
jgi:CIC family chloride channel protein